MSDILAQFGVVGDTLSDQTGSKDYPVVVPNRVAHIDADFTAYQIAADTVAELSGERPLRDLQTKKEQLEDVAMSLARRAGADKYVMHITPTASNKGGRWEQAVQAGYQANRKDKEPPEHLDALRGYMATHMKAIVHLDQEADDGLAQAAYADPQNVVICTKDKDLLMVPGWHLDMNSMELFFVEPGTIGSLELIVKRDGTKGVKGKGPLFFFAQCLMGDVADNVKGLPSVPPSVWMGLTPTAEWNKAVEAENVEKQDKIMAKAKPKPCGPVMTYRLLHDAKSVKEAFNVVRGLFIEAGKYHAFKHWRTEEAVTPTAALLGDMRCLWMRRNSDPDDVLAFLKENV